MNMVNPQKARKRAIEPEINVNFIAIVRKKETLDRRAVLRAEAVPHKVASRADAGIEQGRLVVGFQISPGSTRLVRGLLRREGV